MKNTISKFCITCLFFLSNFIIFAQPSSSNDAGNLENTDAAAASIDDYLWILVILGILFAAYTFKNNRKTIIFK